MSRENLLTFHYANTSSKEVLFKNYSWNENRHKTTPKGVIKTIRAFPLSYEHRNITRTN